MAIQTLFHNFPGIHGQFVILGYVNMKDMTDSISRFCFLYSMEVIVILIWIDWTIKEILAYFTCRTGLKTKIICFPLQAVTNDVAHLPQNQHSLQCLRYLTPTWVY